MIDGGCTANPAPRVRLRPDGAPGPADDRRRRTETDDRHARPRSPADTPALPARRSIAASARRRSRRWSARPRSCRRCATRSGSSVSATASCSWARAARARRRWRASWPRPSTAPTCAMANPATGAPAASPSGRAARSTSSSSMPPPTTRSMTCASCVPRVYTGAADLRRKVFIIDEVQRIKEGWDVLLKTLEEPPEGVLFIFCTTDPSQIRPAVVSRLQRFTFRPLTVARDRGQAAAHPRRGGARGRARGASRSSRSLAGGGMRDAESMLDQVLVSAATPSPRRRSGTCSVWPMSRSSTASSTPSSIGDVLAGIGVLDGLEAEGRDLVAFSEQVVTRLRAVLVERLSRPLGRPTAPLGRWPGRPPPHRHRRESQRAGWLSLAAGALPARPPRTTQRAHRRPMHRGPSGCRDRAHDGRAIAAPGPRAAADHVRSAASSTDPRPSAARRPAAVARHRPYALRPRRPAAGVAARSPRGRRRRSDADDRGHPRSLAADRGGHRQQPGQSPARDAPAARSRCATASSSSASRRTRRSCATSPSASGLVLEDGIAAVIGRPVAVRCVVTNLELVEPVDSGEGDLVAQARRIFEGELAGVEDID